jgi:hypothetical protein
MKATSDIPKIFHRQFAPEHWSKLQTLRALLGDPLPTTPNAYEGLDVCLNHQNKVVIFARLAQRVVPHLPKDREELDQTGASRNEYATEFGVLIESMLCEMYSCLDGLGLFLCAVFPKTRRLQHKSNEKLFRLAKENQYGVDFPDTVRLAMGKAYDDWFPRLRNMRRQITHRSGGFFHLDKDNKVVYFHGSLRQKPEIINDVVGVVNVLEERVRSFLEDIADHFVLQLSPKLRLYPCGNYRARIYLRMVAPGTNLNMHSGHCASWNWFEKDPELFCPLARECGAYRRKWPGGDVAALAGI